MIRFNQAKVRPRSTRTITDFRGLWHNLEDAATLDNSRAIRWYDERNLSGDGAPGLTVRNRRESRGALDENMITDGVIAACGVDQLVLLDEFGNVWCGGYHVDGVLGSYTWSTRCWYERSRDPDLQALAWGRNDASPNNTGYLLTWLVADSVRRLAFVYRMDSDLFPSPYKGWCYNNGVTWVAIELQDYLIDYVLPLTTETQVGDVITIERQPMIAAWYGQPRQIIRMGAKVYIWPDGVAVDTVQLASGITVGITESLSCCLHTTAGDVMRLELCTSDGTTYSTVEGGTTPPLDVTAIWADTSSDTTVLRQYISATSSWDALAKTYVKITIPLMQDTMFPTATGVLREMDAVNFIYEPTQEPVTRFFKELNALLNSSHVLYGFNSEYDSLTGITTYTFIVAGVLPMTVAYVDVPCVLNTVRVQRRVPAMDYVVEAGNRLWGCRYGYSNDGEMVNEIYASALGDPTNWSRYMGISTDSWTASRGRAAPYTGSTTLDGHPLFFREESLEKVYPSSTGAHQIQTFDLEGVQSGSWRSMVIIDDKLYYQSRHGVCVYTGTVPERISAALGDIQLYEGIAARHDKKYCVSARTNKYESTRVVAVYDTRTGDWHLEDEPWYEMAVTWDDRLYYTSNGTIMTAYSWDSEGVKWYAESGIIGYELPEHRYISCVRIRLQIAASSEFYAFIQYDDSGTWLQKSFLDGVDEEHSIMTREINIYPLRCDHFRLKLSGYGPCKVVSLSYRIERSEGGH